MRLSRLVPAGLAPVSAPALAPVGLVPVSAPALVPAGLAPVSAPALAPAGLVPVSAPALAPAGLDPVSAPALLPAGLPPLPGAVAPDSLVPLPGAVAPDDLVPLPGIPAPSGLLDRAGPGRLSKPFPDTGRAPAALLLTFPSGRAPAILLPSVSACSGRTRDVPDTGLRGFAAGRSIPASSGPDLGRLAEAVSESAPEPTPESRRRLRLLNLSSSCPNSFSKSRFIRLSSFYHVARSKPGCRCQKKISRHAPDLARFMLSQDAGSILNVYGMHINMHFY